MMLSILDRSFNTLAVMDNSLLQALHFFDDEFHRYLKQATATFDFSVLKKHQDSQYLMLGNYICFEYQNRDFLFTIRRIEEDEVTMKVYTEDLSFDLLNEYCSAYTATKAQTIDTYLKQALTDSDVVIGYNELSGAKKLLSWDSESTALARVLSIVEQFDAECEFITELHADRSLKQITLNIYHQFDETHQGVGVNRTDVELRYGENVQTIRRTEDASELFTCIRPVGKDNLSITAIDETIYDGEGNIQFYTKKGSAVLYAPLANSRFGRKNAEKGGYINMPFASEQENSQALYTEALSELKKYSEPAIEYEVEGFYDVGIGDNVTIIDSKYQPTLLLEARVSEQILSFSNRGNDQSIFSNYRVFESQVSVSLLKQVEEMRQASVDAAKYAEQLANTPLFKLAVDGSVIFKNGLGSVKLTVQVEKNSTDITQQFETIRWKKQRKDGTIDEIWTSAHSNAGQSVTILPSDFEDSGTFTYEVLVDGAVYGAASATVVKLYDGETGEQGIQGEQGAPGVQGAVGEKGTSVTTTIEEYYVSTSATTQVGGSWVTKLPTEIAVTKFVWRRVKTVLSDGAITYTIPVVMTGLTGSYPVIDNNQPFSPVDGQQWWKTDSAGNVVGYFVYRNGAWQEQTIQQSILNIVDLNAVNISGSSITGTEIAGSSFKVNFEKDYGLYINRGYMSIADGSILIEFDQLGSSGTVNSRHKISLLPTGLLFQAYEPDGSLTLQTSYNYTGFGMRNHDGAYGEILFNDIRQTAASLTPQAGFEQYATGQSQANHPFALRRMGRVSLYGAFKNTSVLAANNSTVMCVLPPEFIPKRTVYRRLQGSYANQYLLTINPTGEMIVSRYGTTASIDVPVNSWLNIGCEYDASY